MLIHAEDTESYKVLRNNPVKEIKIEIDSPLKQAVEKH